MGYVIQEGDGFLVTDVEDMHQAFSDATPIRVIGETDWRRVVGRSGNRWRLMDDSGEKKLIDFEDDKFEMHPEPLITRLISSKETFLESMARATEREWVMLALALKHYFISNKYLEKSGIMEWAKKYLASFKKSIYLDDDDDGYGPFDSHSPEGLWIEENLARTACEIASASAEHQDLTVRGDICRGVVNILEELKYNLARFVAARLIYILNGSEYHDYFETHEKNYVYAKYVLKQFAHDKIVGQIARETLLDKHPLFTRGA